VRLVILAITYGRVGRGHEGYVGHEEVQELDKICNVVYIQVGETVLPPDEIHLDTPIKRGLRNLSRMNVLQQSSDMEGTWK
jgi:hypothetical protein